MRQFEVDTVEVRRVSWHDGTGSWSVRDSVEPGEPTVELLRDEHVVLTLTGAQAQRLRAALAHFEGEELEDTRPARTGRVKPAQAGQPWKAEDDARLAELHAAGEPTKAIATALERTTYGIESRLVRLGLAPPQPNGWRGLRAPTSGVGE